MLEKTISSANRRKSGKLQVLIEKEGKNMLEIHYSIGDSNEQVKTYEKASDFVAAQYKEVPDLQDNYLVIKALIDGKEVQLEESSIGGLFTYLNTK